MYNKKIYIPLLSIALSLVGTQASYAQFSTITSNSLPTAHSPNFSENEGGINWYVRALAYGGGQSGGENGAENYDLATSFAEAAIRANYKKGFSDGYVILCGEARLRYGQYFNGKLTGSTGTNAMYQTDLELRDAYVGYRGRKIEVLLGNQNVQWGRGMGNNPTNNISPSNMMFLSGNPADSKMYTFMLNTNYQLQKGLDLQVVASAMPKTSILPLQLFALGPLDFKEQDNYKPQFKNGTIAARLNWNNGPMGASVSYYNGVDPFPSMRAWFNEEGGVSGQTVNCRKQTIGADFGIRIGGKPRGANFVPTNDMMIMGEVGYNIYKKDANAPWIPQDNLGFNLAVLKMIYAPNNMDVFTGVVSWYGRYTPDFHTLENLDITADPNGYMENMNVNFSRFFFGQQKPLDHTLMLMASQTFLRGKLAASIVFTHQLSTPTDFMGNPDKKNILLSPSVNYNISQNLSLSSGYRHMWGSTATQYGPILGGAFVELKAQF